VFYILKKRLSVARKQIRTTNQKSYQHLLDALKGYVEANIFDRHEFFMERFIRQRKKFSGYLFESLALQNMPSRIIEIFAILGLFILIAIAQWSGNNDSSALITVGAFMAAAYKIIPGIVKLINVTGQIKACEYSIDELLTKEEIKVENNHKPVSINSVELKNISFQYNGIPVLDHFNLSLKRGDFAAITGESGKGKTTIINLLLGFLEPDCGEIFINGSGMNKENIQQFWPTISYVKQQTFLIHDTAIHNITLEEEKFNKENLKMALDASGIHKKFPEVLNKVITENGKNISGGQQQRIAMARAIYKNADLFLLDEPFNELDEDSSRCMLEYFRQLSQQGKIVIIITHDRQSLAYCNKIISLNEG
jgi:ABC-type bacteriocin/lantibiotic exporter with double-glycine peptidase domain